MMMILLLLAACGGGASVDPDASITADAAIAPDATRVPPGLRLVTPRDHIDGFFLTPGTITADATRIYLASRGSGKLFVLARDEAAGFPTVQTIDVPATGLTSVATDATNVYVTTAAGEVITYTKGDTLAYASTHVLAPRGFSEDAAWNGNRLVIADGSTKLALDADHVWLATLNDGDAADAFNAPGLTNPMAHYAPPLDWTTVARFTRDGVAAGTLPAPVDGLGNTNPPAIRAGHGQVALFDPGCCGLGVELYDAASNAHVATIPRTFADDVAWSGDYLVIGGEDGFVDLWQGDQEVASVDLRTVTGHTGSEDIEIRSLWVDDVDRFVFAGSSWGNDQSRTLDLPSFFVLERTGD